MIDTITKQIQKQKTYLSAFAPAFVDITISEKLLALFLILIIVCVRVRVLTVTLYNVYMSSLLSSSVGRKSIGPRIVFKTFHFLKKKNQKISTYIQGVSKKV